MKTYTINKKYALRIKISRKTAKAMQMFGVDKYQLSVMNPEYKCTVRVHPGQIVYITGPSGAGKSTILKQFYRHTDSSDRLWLDQIELDSNETLLDSIECECNDSVKLLSKAGLSDVFTLFNRPAALSNGQKYRYRLIKALTGKKQIIFADEFCSTLDRLSAAVISFNLREDVLLSNKTFFLASSHDDILEDLDPDVIIIKHPGLDPQIKYTATNRNL